MNLFKLKWSVIIISLITLVVLASGIYKERLSKIKFETYFDNQEKQSYLDVGYQTKKGHIVKYQEILLSYIKYRQYQVLKNYRDTSSKMTLFQYSSKFLTPEDHEQFVEDNIEHRNIEIDYE